KKYLYLFTCLLICFSAGAANIINKILYKKVIINSNQENIINIFLNPTQKPIKDVIIFFNRKEVKDLNKNLVPYNDNFLPSVSFEVNKVTGFERGNSVSNNVLEIFLILQNGMTYNYDAILPYEKGLVIDEDDHFVVNNHQVFFVKAGNYSDDGIYFKLTIGNSSIIQKLDDLVYQGYIYYRLKSISPGKTQIEIFKYDTALETQNIYPFKVINITSK
ncbi:MAG: hypothetical protein MJB14_14695, partial [Spirochaetes bacterium]|nr:hypothetical protein [Spirochaetota bacterium]